MDNFDLRKYLAEGKLHENLQIDDLFGEYVAQWSQGNYDYDFAELKPGPIKGSLVDDFTLGPDEYDDDDYVRDYKMMRDYLLKNKSYELSRDEKEGLSQFPVQFSLEDDGETIKADIYYSPEYLAMVDADLAEGRLYENILAQKLRDEAKHPDSKVGAAILNKYAEKVEKANKEDYVKLLKDMESELISKHPDTFSGEDDIPGSFLSEDKLNEEEMSFDDDIENKTNKNDFAFWYRSGARGKAQALKAKDLLTKNGIDADYSKGPFYISFSNAGVEERVVQQMLRDANLDRFVIMRDKD